MQIILVLRGYKIKILDFNRKYRIKKKMASLKSHLALNESRIQGEVKLVPLGRSNHCSEPDQGNPRSSKSTEEGLEGVRNPKAAEAAFPRRDMTEGAQPGERAAQRGTRLPLLLSGSGGSKNRTRGEKQRRRSGGLEEGIVSSGAG